MKKLKQVLQRPLAALAAVALLVGVATPMLTHGNASAAQITTRSIGMSTAVPNATGVTYTVTFDTATAFASGIDVVMEFCDNSPLLEAACSYNNTTAGTNTVPLLGGASSSAGTLTALGSNNVVRITGVAAGSISAGTTETFNITNVRNPAINTDGVHDYEPFYARIYVYNAGDASTDYSAPASDDSAGTFAGGATAYVDGGGVALSTASTINITANVMESLSICTSAVDISGNSLDPSSSGNPAFTSCTNATAPNITIGHGSPTKIIDALNVDTASAYYQLSTNATSGAIIHMKATNACANGGLSTDGGTTCTDIPGNNATPALINAGDSDWGMYASTSALSAGVGTASGTITPDPTYNDGTHNGISDNYFAMPGAEVTSTYGSQIGSTGGPVSQVNDRLDFGATAGLTTPAGIYTGGESLIATGTF